MYFAICCLRAHIWPPILYVLQHVAIFSHESWPWETAALLWRPRLSGHHLETVKYGLCGTRKRWGICLDSVLGDVVFWRFHGVSLLVFVTIYTIVKRHPDSFDYGSQRIWFKQILDLKGCDSQVNRLSAPRWEKYGICDKTCALKQLLARCMVFVALLSKQAKHILSCPRLSRPRPEAVSRLSAPSQTPKHKRKRDKLVTATNSN